MITGAGRNIGKAMAKLFASEGAKIAVAEMHEGRGQAVVDEINKSGQDAMVVLGDVAKSSDVREMVKKVVAKFGAIDILVNNAGIALLGHLTEATVDDWDTTMAVNLRAPFLLARELVPAMIRQKRGKIVNVSSQAGVVGLDAHGAYCASKGGLNMLTKVMTVEWARHNIQINTVCPTVILTPMGEQVWGKPEIGDPMRAKIPGDRFGKPVEVADAILYLASSASDMVCGHDLLIDGGYTAV